MTCGFSLRLSLRCCLFCFQAGECPWTSAGVFGRSMVPVLLVTKCLDIDILLYLDGPYAVVVQGLFSLSESFIRVHCINGKKRFGVLIPDRPGRMVVIPVPGLQE